MKKLTTDDALTELLSKRGVYHELKESESTVRSWRKRHKEGQLNEAMKMEILQLAGFKVVQERMWSAPQ